MGRHVELNHHATKGQIVGRKLWHTKHKKGRLNFNHCSMILSKTEQQCLH